MTSANCRASTSLFLVILLVSLSYSVPRGFPSEQSRAGSKPGQPVRWSMTLASGYRQVFRSGIDSQVGDIVGQDGFTISYDMGMGAYTNCTNCEWTAGEVWRKKPILNGEEAVFVFTSSVEGKRLVVSFPRSEANFHAVIDSESHLSDMILMLSTFRGGKGR